MGMAMKKNRLKVSTIVALAFLVALTTSLFSLNQAKRRAYVPAMKFRLPSVTIAGRLKPNQVESLCFAPRGEKLLIGDRLFRLHLADLNDASIRQLSGKWALKGDWRYGELSWNSDGSRIFNLDGTGAWWRTSQNKAWHQLIQLPLVNPNNFEAYRTRDPIRVSLSPTGRLAIISENDKPEWRRLKLLNLVNQRQHWAVGVKKPDDFITGAGGGVCGLLFSPNEQQVMIATRAYQFARSWSIMVHRVNDGRRLTHFEIASREFSCYSDVGDDPLSLAFSPDGRFLAIVGMNEVGLFSIQNGSLVARLPQSSQYRTYKLGRPPIAFSPDGQLLAVSYGKYIEVWNLKQRQLRQLFFTTSQALAFSSDGKWLASNTSAEPAVSIWEVGSLAQ